MVLAVGCLVDLEFRPADCPDAEKFHQLARASLCEIPVMEETNVETITALFYEIWYLLVFSDKKKAAGYAWGLMGLTAKLAQRLASDRNGGKSKVIPEEVEKRRSLFWELLYLDARLSLSLGRPPSLSINHMDCQRPSYPPDDDCALSESLHYYQEWKHLCYLQCLAPVLDAISKPSLEYTTVLDLDKTIRDFSIPAPLRQKELHSRSLIMQKASLSTLHRTFFTRALSGPEEAFNRRHKYAPSVVAVFLSASRMIATVQDLYHREPQLTARILGYWSNAFSAAVALCLLVSRAPFTCLSPAALQELERARILFRSAKDTCPRAHQVIPILETMIDKANYIYNRWSNGQELPTIVLQHITDEFAVDSDVSPSGGSANSVPNGPENSQPLSPTQVDSFRFTHRSLSQCIVEAHQRAKSLFPMRKPCNCSVALAKNCPPSHSWAPPPSVPQQTSPVLPEVPPALSITMSAMSPSANSGSRGSPAGHGVSPVPSSSSARVSSSPALSDGYGLYSAQVLPGDGPAIPPPPVPALLSPTSKMAVVDTLNFELGALNSHSDQSWMAFF
ncbi:hypothetical protein BDQ17DRAFT_1240026 [Cyathus striatus]|nr:hypothetical protein BDQ17DRAFT_1240026 [Cyathus striatus]